MCRFERRFAEQYAIVGNDSNRIPIQPSKACHNGCTITGLEFMKARSVHNPGNNLAHIEWLLGVHRYYTTQFLQGIQWRLMLIINRNCICTCWNIQILYNIPCNAHGMCFIFRQMIRHARLFAVHIGTTQIFRCDNFTSRSLDQRRTTEEYRSITVHYDSLIGHGWHVGSTSRTGATHHGYLGDAAAGHVGLVEEDATEVLLVGKHLILFR
mmetsp:Transcript_6142/g.9004  ORF Transcript_6142/g.9004 Transcript_6142/m.9004 type:complete len:211 (+) Transcript_6142:631-1263(+)